MDKVRWGILGTANIAIEKVIPAMQQSQYCDIVAIASRDSAKALEAAKKFKIKKSFSSYEALLADEDIDAVYIPLPNNMHVPWAISALKAGKHVLCEKPISLTAAEAQQLADTAKSYSHLKVMEAFMYRFHPQWILAKKLVDEERIGKLSTIQCFFSYHNTNPLNIRNMPQAGGGALMDIGCYCISQSRYIFGADPLQIQGVMDHDPEMGTDRLTSAILRFKVGTATFTCSTQSAPYQRVNIVGTTGRIEIDIPVNVPHDIPSRIWLHTPDNKEEIVFDACNQYTLQCDEFSKAVLNNRPVPTSIDDAIKNMKVIEALVKSNALGTWVHIP